MLSLFRRGITKQLMLVVLVIALFAIVVTGFGTGGSGLGDVGTGSSNIAKVGGLTVTSKEVNDQIDRQIERARQENPELTVPQFLANGRYEDIVRQLIAQKALVAFGQEQGLAASKRMVDGEIASFAAFHNLAGQFDPEIFRQALAQQRMSEDDLRREVTGQLIQRQMYIPIAAGVVAPEAMTRLYATLLLERRTGSVGVVPAAAMSPGRPPTDAELKTYYDANEARYAVPELRVLRYAAFGPEVLGAAGEVSEAEVAQFYRTNAARYGATETRALAQVILPDQAAARTFAARVNGGAAFADVARQAGFGPADTNVGEVTKAQFTELANAAAANAVFGAAEGATVGPVQTPLGWHVVRVEQVRRTAARPIEAVAAEIRGELGAQKRSQGFADLVTRIEDAIGNGASLDEVARANRLTLIETPPLTATGAQPGGAATPPSPDLQPLLSAAFDMAEDDDPEVVSLAAGQRAALFGLVRIQPAASPPLRQIADRVRADLVRQRANDRARAIAQSIAGKINAGTPAARAFAEAEVKGPPLQSITARRIDIAQPNRPVPPPLTLLFSLPPNSARILAAPNNTGWFVVHHASSQPGDAASAPGLVEATRSQFRNMLGDEYAAQFTRAVEAGVKVSRNEDAIRQLRTQLMGVGSQ